MAFEILKPESRHSYDGLFVGSRIVNISLSVARQMEEKGFENVSVEYDKEESLIKIGKSARGHRFKGGLLQARIARVMPTGRYELIKSSAKEFLFKKIT